MKRRKPAIPRSAGPRSRGDLPERLRGRDIHGTGACPEAQADGVPCEDPHGDCEVCQRARKPARIPSTI